MKACTKQLTHNCSNTFTRKPVSLEFCPYFVTNTGILKWTHFKASRIHRTNEFFTLPQQIAGRDTIIKFLLGPFSVSIPITFCEKPFGIRRVPWSEVIFIFKMKKMQWNSITFANDMNEQSLGEKLFF